MTTEVGRIHAGTPWTRAAVRELLDRYPTTLRLIEERIPAGCWLVLVTTGRPHHWNALLWNADGEVARGDGAYPTIPQACWAALAAAELHA